jgi:polyhydroxybutyrate depolymerase
MNAPTERLRKTTARAIALSVCLSACDSPPRRSARAPAVSSAQSTVTTPTLVAEPAVSNLQGGASAAADPAGPGAAFDPPAKLYLPAHLGVGERVPLLMVLHGFGVSSALLVEKVGLNRMADAKRFAYLAPEGSHDSLGRPFWNAGPSCCDLEHRTLEDTQRLRALLEFNLQNRAIDPKRVFLIGDSNGAFMAERLACEMSDHLAGLISVAGAAAGPEVPCAPSSPLSVLEIHGDADPIVHYEGGVVFDRSDLSPYPSALDTAKAWAQRLNCSGNLQSTGQIDLEPNISGRETDMQHFTGCRGAVELWTVRGGGHYVALQPPAIDAMWQFLIAHSASGT